MDKRFLRYSHPFVSLQQRSPRDVQVTMNDRGQQFLQAFEGDPAWGLKFDSPGNPKDEHTPIGFLSGELINYGARYVDAIYKPTNGCVGGSIEVGTRLGFTAFGTLHPDKAKKLELEAQVDDYGRPSDPQFADWQPGAMLNLDDIPKNRWSYLTFVLVDKRYRGRNNGIRIPEDHLTVFEYMMLEWLRDADKNGCHTALVRTHRNNHQFVALCHRWGFGIVADYPVVQYHQTTQRVLLAKVSNGESPLAAVI